ncbi:MAG: glycosyltransferase family 4 protein [Chitinispirillales bacterium]|jgi:glycosyltransferase involved in cell wall biosynthesis|nr:glycosyltransferase family 4 protein [Chitinispirillales bacterium]
MKVLVLNWRDMEHPEAGGAEVHFFEIFGRLADKGHDITLLCSRFKGCQNNADYRGIKILRRGNNLLFNRQTPSIIKKLLKTERYDCIIDDVNKLPFYTNRRFPSIPCGAFFHHLFGKTVFSLTNWPTALYIYLTEKHYAHRHKNIHCCAVSQSTADELEKQGIDKSKLTIIENGIDTDRYCIDESTKREEDLLLFVGRLKKYKRVDNIFKAMSILDKSGYVTRLAIVGTGDDMPRLKKSAGKLGLGDRVEFVGFVDEDKKIEYYRKAAIFVNPSEKEGWGITNIEAAACGTPVVANDAPGLRDSVVNNETGLLYSENDIQSLACSLKKMLDDRDLQKKLGESGRLRAQNFSWDASAQKVEEWLQKIIREK